MDVDSSRPASQGSQFTPLDFSQYGGPLLTQGADCSNIISTSPTNYVSPSLRTVDAARHPIGSKLSQLLPPKVPQFDIHETSVVKCKESSASRTSPSNTAQRKISGSENVEQPRFVPDALVNFASDFKILVALDANVDIDDAQRKRLEDPRSWYFPERSGTFPPMNVPVGYMTYFEQLAEQHCRSTEDKALKLQKQILDPQDVRLHNSSSCSSSEDDSDGTLLSWEPSPNQRPNKKDELPPNSSSPAPPKRSMPSAPKDRFFHEEANDADGADEDCSSDLDEGVPYAAGEKLSNSPGEAAKGRSHKRRKLKTCESVPGSSSVECYSQPLQSEGEDDAYFAYNHAAPKTAPVISKTSGISPDLKSRSNPLSTLPASSKNESGLYLKPNSSSCDDISASKQELTLPGMEDINTSEIGRISQTQYTGVPKDNPVSEYHSLEDPAITARRERSAFFGAVPKLSSDGSKRSVHIVSDSAAGFSSSAVGAMSQIEIPSRSDSLRHLSNQASELTIYREHKQDSQTIFDKLYGTFCSIYPTYTGAKEHFRNVCMHIATSNIQGQDPLDIEWDDYIMQHALQYVPYARRLVKEAQVPTGYEDFYKSLSRASESSPSRVINKETLKAIKTALHEPRAANDEIIVAMINGNDTDRVLGNIASQGSDFQSTPSTKRPRVAQPTEQTHSQESDLESDDEPSESLSSLEDFAPEDTDGAPFERWYQSGSTPFKEFGRSLASLNRVRRALGNPIYQTHADGVLKLDGAKMNVLDWAL